MQLCLFTIIAAVAASDPQRPAAIQMDEDGTTLSVSAGDGGRYSIYKIVNCISRAATSLSVRGRQIKGLPEAGEAERQGMRENSCFFLQLASLHFPFRVDEHVTLIPS